MAEFGYIPADGGLSERARIPAVSEAKYFLTSAIYIKRKQANYKIEVSISEI